MNRSVSIPKDEIANFCRLCHIRRLSLFGSVLGDDFGPDSDVDVLVEFEPGHTPGYEFFAMEAEMAGIIGARSISTRPRFSAATSAMN